ncbi:hypothetical protein Q1695_016254 [Nippostrongylus brasiliensis]|nr:hypothetical protein Q1695_016254 [Nippostrongylus brasiliensis]
MEAKTVLLLNATVMLLISFATDHWILLKIREGPPPSSCNVSVSRQMRWLRCPNVSYALVEQHINLYRQCNDMTEGYRWNASHGGQLYASSCYWFIGHTSEKWRLLHTNWAVDLFCLLSASTAVCLQLLAVVSSQQYQKQQQTSHLLSATLLLYTLPIVVTVYIIHMTNIRKPSNEAQAMYYCEVGWSLVCACIAVVLSGIASYIFLMEHRSVRDRQLSSRRRKQIHNAIMSSCREEVAMAIRARMTVI